MTSPSSNSVIQTLDIEAESLVAARWKMRSQIPTGCHFSEQVVSDGTPRTIRAVADTVGAAFEKAHGELPSDATVTGKSELTTSKEQVVTVAAFDEASVRRDMDSRNALVKTLRLVATGSGGFLGIGKRPHQYEARVFQQAVVEVTYTVPARISVSIQGRAGDGTILGDLIAKGAYSPQAGIEKIGYFDPHVAPFRTLPGGKTGLLGGAEADTQGQLRAATFSTFGSMFSESQDETVNLIVELCDKLSLVALPSIRTSPADDLLKGFMELVKHSAVDEFLTITTTMPFFLTYSTAQTTVVAEVDHELKLNALANLLICDKSIRRGGSTIRGFGDKVASLLETRKQEVDEKKQWAIELQRVRNA